MVTEIPHQAQAASSSVLQLRKHPDWSRDVPAFSLGRGILQRLWLQPRATAAAAAAAAKSRSTLCDPIDGSSPSSSLPGILQGRILEWVAISFSTNQEFLGYQIFRLFPLVAQMVKSPPAMQKTGVRSLGPRGGGWGKIEKGMTTHSRFP